MEGVLGTLKVDENLVLELLVEGLVFQAILDLLKHVREDRLRRVVSLELAHHLEEGSARDPIVDSDAVVEVTSLDCLSLCIGCGDLCCAFAHRSEMHDVVYR